MATWHATATDEVEEEAPETLPQKIWGFIKKIWGWFVKLLIFLFAAWLFFSGMALLSLEDVEIDAQATYTTITQEDADAVIQQLDKQLWRDMMNIANSLNYMEKDKPFVLGDDKSREFGEAYFQPNADIHVSDVRFYDDSVSGRTAEITYELGVNKTIHLVFRDNHIKKEMTRYEGFSGSGSFLRYLQWYTYGRFMKGYPRYTCDVPMNSGQEFGTRTATKSVVKLMPFSRVVRFFSLLRRVI